MTSSIEVNNEFAFLTTPQLCLPTEILEIIFSFMSTKDLLLLRSTCNVWNIISKRLLRLRYCRLATDWDQRDDGMELFNIFHPNCIPWSGCILGVGLQQVYALRYPFFYTYGNTITSLEVQEFALTFNILDVLRMLPNLEKLCLPKPKRQHSYELNIKDQFMLPRLKFLHLALCSDNYRSNADYITFLVGIVPSNLKLLEISNFTITEHLNRIASRLEKFPSIHLAIEIYREEAFSVFDQVKLNVHSLKMVFSKSISPWKHNFITSFNQLKFLTMTMCVRNPYKPSQFIKVPGIPTLKHLFIDFGNWTCPIVTFQHNVENELVIWLKNDMFPKLEKLTVSSNNVTINDMKELVTTTFSNGTKAKCFGSGSQLLQDVSITVNFHRDVHRFPKLKLSDDAD